LSTLTKILIVLLTISSIFLCGIVVTYVANADNYRQKYEDRETRIRALTETEEDAKTQLKEKTDEYSRQESILRSQITELKTEIAQKEDTVRTIEREKAGLLESVNSYASKVESANQTAQQQTQLFENAQAELEKVKAELTKKRKELNELTLSLTEKLAIIDDIRIKNRRLTEEKTELLSRLDRLSRPIGKEPVRPTPVTPERDIAKVATPLVRDIGLRGSVTDVDLKNSMAEISIGAVNGVKVGNTFHVTRGGRFICDILIIDVETEKAVGFLEKVQPQQQPRVGDRVSTNL